MAWITDDAPTPGSAEAVEQGCTCPRIDNHYGRGYMDQEGVFVTAMGCPLHDCPEPEED